MVCRHGNADYTWICSLVLLNEYDMLVTHGAIFFLHMHAAGEVFLHVIKVLRSDLFYM